MSARNPEDQSLTARFIKTWLPFIAVILTLSGMWWSQNSKVNQLQVDLARVEAASLTRDENLIKTVEESMTRIEAAALDRDEKLAKILDDHSAVVAETKALRDEQYLQIQVTLTAMQKDLTYLRTEYETHSESVTVKP